MQNVPAAFWHSEKRSVQPAFRAGMQCAGRKLTWLKNERFWVVFFLPHIKDECDNI
ncbi:hypothetical protein AAKU55_001373 [Oxalobacteraceae bacterium GrIS 1.11]